jgi:hypothetical protein
LKKLTGNSKMNDQNTFEVDFKASDYPEFTSSKDSMISGDFGSLSAQEQETQRDDWKTDLGKTEEEIITLRNVLASKEAHAQELKHRLGITAWREFSEDMQQGLKNLQDSQAAKKAGEAMTAAKNKTASVWSSIASSQSFISASQKMGSAFGAAKMKVSSSFQSQQNLGEVYNTENGKTENGKEAADAIPEEK